MNTLSVLTSFRLMGLVTNASGIAGLLKGISLTGLLGSVK